MPIFIGDFAGFFDPRENLPSSSERWSGSLSSKDKIAPVKQRLFFTVDYLCYARWIYAEEVGCKEMDRLAIDFLAEEDR